MNYLIFLKKLKNMRFEIGDKVKVIKTGYGLVQRNIGKVFVIVDIRETDTGRFMYKLKEPDKEYNYSSYFGGDVFDIYYPIEEALEKLDALILKKEYETQI